MPDGGTSCVANTTPDSREARAKLLARTDGSLVYMAVNGEQLEYSAPVSTRLRGLSNTRTFLTAIRDRLGTRTLASVTYGTPTGCTSGAPGTSDGGIGPAGVPYVSQVTGLNGTALYFSYSNVVAGGPCVLSSVAVGRGAARVTAITYGYETRGYPFEAYELISATQNGSTERYFTDTGSSPGYYKELRVHSDALTVSSRDTA